MAVEGPDGLGGPFEDDGIGTAASGNGGDGGQRGAVEDDHCVAAAVGDVTKFSGSIECDAVRAVQAVDGADEFTCLRIDNIHAEAVS